MATEVSSYARGTQPYSCIGLIWATFPNGKTVTGTCTLVGRNDILTATHMVYSPDDGGWAVGYDFYFGADYNHITYEFEDDGYKYSPSDSSVAAWPDQTFADYNNETMIPSETKFDIAMIGVAEPIGDVLGWLGLDSGYNGSHSANAVGYPVGTTGMMQETVTVQKDFHNEIYESNYTTMGPGSSGGPLLIDNYVIGVMSAGVGNTAMWADVGTVYSSLTDFMDSNDSLLGTIADTTAPTVSSFSPSDGAANVSTTANIVVTFSEAIQRGTGVIGLWNTSTGIYVETFDVATNSRLTFSGSTLTIDPLNTLTNKTGYFVTFDTGNIKDLAGNAYGGTYDYDFTTIAATIIDDYLYDTGTHGIVSVNGSATRGVIETAGDKDMFKVDLTAGKIYTFDLIGTSGELFNPYLELFSSTRAFITANDDGGIFPNSRISYTPTTSGTYFLGAMNLGVGTGAYTLSATASVADNTAPTLLTFNPANNSTGVATSANLVLNFSEAIHTGAGNILIYNASGTFAKAIAVTDSSQVSISGTTVTINPNTDFTAGGGYIVKIAAGVFKDLAGNSFAGINDTTTYNFTTIAAPIALVEGTPLNDRLIASSQNESINGADGIDTVVYSGLRNSYTITKTNQNITITDIANSKSIDTLISIERLAFSDQNIALDLDGHAGTTARILGAVFGADAVSNTSYAGIGLKLLDDGMSYESLMALAIDAAGAITPQAVVYLLWNNVVGGLPSNEQAQPFVDMLNSGLSIGQLGMLAADTDLNKVNIDLVGLAPTGLAYTEVP